MLIHDYLDYWATRDPDREVLTDGTVSWSRAELVARSRRIAHFLAEHVQPDERFGVLAKNSFDYLAIYLGASYCGAVPVPLNYRLAPPEWRFILDDAGAKIVLADTDLAAALDPVRSDIGEATGFFTMGGELDPRAVLRRRDTTFRKAGLSAAKTRSIKDLARHVADGRVEPETLHELDDDEVRELLADDAASLVMCGGTHVPFERVVDDVNVINVGSVGDAPEGRVAHFTIISPNVAGYAVDQTWVEY